MEKERKNMKKQGLWLAAGLVWCVVATVGMLLPFMTEVGTDHPSVTVGFVIVWTLFACAVLDWLSHKG